MSALFEQFNRFRHSAGLVQLALTEPYIIVYTVLFKVAFECVDIFLQRIRYERVLAHLLVFVYILVAIDFRKRLRMLGNVAALIPVLRKRDRILAEIVLQVPSLI